MENEISDMNAHNSKKENTDDISIAFRWMKERAFNDEKRIDDALQCISVLEVEDFFKAAIFLIWIEADRQKSLQEEEKRYDYVQKIIDKINEIPKSKETVNWGKFFSLDFMSWWVEYVNSVWPFERLKQIDLVIMRVGNDTLYDLFELQAQNNFQFFYNILVPITDKNENPLFRSEVLALLASALTENGEIEEAKEVLKSAIRTTESIPSDHNKDNAFSKIATVSARMGNLELAISTANNISYPFFNYEAFSNIATAFIETENLETIISIIDKIEWDGFRYEAFSNISTLLARKGDFLSAIKITDNIKSDRYKSIANANLAKEYAFSGNKEKANAILESAVSIADNLESHDEKSDAWVNLSKVLVSIGETSKALELLESILNLNYIPVGLIVKNDIFSEVAVIYANIGEYKSAFDTADKIELSEEDRILTYSKIIIALAEKGDMEKAKEIFETVIILNKKLDEF